MAILGFLAALILAILFGYFAFLNQVPVTLHFFWPFGTQRAFLHEVAGYSAIVGALVSAFLAIGPWLHAARTARALRRQLRSLEEETKGLREAAGSPRLYPDTSSRLPSARTPAVARADEEPV